MPSYEFHCEKCKKEFEVVKSISEYDEKKIVCTHCKSKKVKRIYTPFMAKTSKKS